MATVLAFNKVPTFTLYEIRLAHLCALHLWYGREFDTGKIAECSDEKLLIEFSSRFEATRANKKTAYQIPEYLIRQLIRVARLKALYRSTSKINFPKGIRTIRNSSVKTYDNWLANPASLTPTGHATKAILDLGLGFVTQPRGVNAPKNYRVPLASRVLFFAAPEMMIFNFSNGLGKAMNFQSRPQAAIPHFNIELYDGLQRNDALLFRCTMPPPQLLSQESWNRANNGGWWKRRVLDIALLLHYKVAYAHHDLVLLARSGYPVI